MKTWLRGFWRMLKVLFGWRDPDKWPEPTWDPRQRDAEQIAAEYLGMALKVSVYGSCGFVLFMYKHADGTPTYESVRLPRVGWNDRGFNKTRDAHYVAASSFFGWAHELGHSIPLQLGRTTNHDTSDDWYDFDNGKWEHTTGHVAEIQRRLLKAGLQ